MFRKQKEYPVVSWPDTSTRIILLVLIFLTVAMGISLSGGFLSPLCMLLLIPTLFGSLYFGLVGGLLTAFLVGGYEVFLYLQEKGDAASTPYAILQVLTFLLTATILGTCSDRIIRHLRKVRQTAQQAHTRALEAEWLADTTLMMQSIPNLEQSLSVALIRLDELISFHSAAVFVRVGDDPQLQLIQSMSLPEEHIGVSRLTAQDQRQMDCRSSGVLTWTTATREAHLPFADIDRTMASGMVIPLCTLDTLIGMIFLGAQRADGFSAQEQETLTRFAQHILYPIQRARLQTMATTDLLTGLSNRRAFWETLRNETERVRRYMHPLSLILLDIDHFKQINDTYGHLTGDSILTQLGRVVKQTIRESDFGARYGGEELAIISPETGSEEASRFAERLRSTIAETAFRATDGRCIRLTVSLGIATMPIHTSDPEQLLECADAALYRAKGAGRNCVCVSDILACARQ